MHYFTFKVISLIINYLSHKIISLYKMTSSSKFDIQSLLSLDLTDRAFASLMSKRIYNVLVIASRYDMFTLEDDGRIDEQIFNEYVSLNLRYPPRFNRVSNVQEAMEEMVMMRYELVICMPNMDTSEIFESAKAIKITYPEIPIILLTPFSKIAVHELQNKDLTAMDYIFSWLGNSELLLAIIKLIEDKMNVEQDVNNVGVQTILLVEDSVRFYSSALPLLYNFVLRESKEFSKEALNDHQRMLRMRGRPKILLARNYEEAESLYNKYGQNMLGVISDMSFVKNGKQDDLAGKKLCEWIYSQDKYMPIIYASSEFSNEKYANAIGANFIHKSSETFSQELLKAIKERLGFGDFIIRNPITKEEVMRIKNLKELQMNIFEIPEDSLYYHLSRNHFSRFFYTRAMFPVAEVLRRVDVSQYASIDDAREFIFQTIVKYRQLKNRGTVAVFEKERFDKFSNFARIGEGSMGGKGRGLAFVDSIVKNRPELNEAENFQVIIPKTIVLCTDIFDEFMEKNSLYDIAMSDVSDEEIFNKFMEGELSSNLIEDINVLLNAIENPVAIRSSSLLEDSKYQPFAGIYSTYMIPYINNRERMIELICNAIKGVYASVYFKDSKSYVSFTENLIDQEKMAIVIQEVVGKDYGDYFYPAISGVARSVNFYPLGNETAEDGVVNMAMGLGKIIVDGGSGLRFSPSYAQNILQLSDIKLALRDTQKYFYALKRNLSENKLTRDENFGIVKVQVSEAGLESPLPFIGSTYDANDEILRSGYYPNGRKIVTFANQLLYNQFPLAQTLDKVLTIGQEEMNRPIEIEFAVNIDNVNTAQFYILQIRPIVETKDFVDDNVEENISENTLLFSSNVLGNGLYQDINDIVYVKTDDFDALNNTLICEEIEQLNNRFKDSGSSYILVGPGRWGSSDKSLGIPVSWSTISQAKIIAEIALGKYQIEPSQGTHFFQNITSLGVGYFTINSFLENDDLFNESYLKSLPSAYEGKYIRQIHFDKPLSVILNGKKRIGIINIDEK